MVSWSFKVSSVLEAVELCMRMMKVDEDSQAGVDDVGKVARCGSRWL